MNAEDSVKADFNRLRRSNGAVNHQVVIAVRQRNVEKLEAILYEVSDPTSKSYGKHWTRDQMCDFVRNDESVAVIKRFLSFHDVTITRESLCSEYLTMDAPVAVWERLLSANFFEYENVGRSKKSSALHRATAGFVLPTELEAHVSYLFNVAELPVKSALSTRIHKIPKQPSSHLRSTATLTGVVTPSLLNSVYDITSNYGYSEASQGIYASLDQYLSPSDLTQFQQTFDLPEQDIFQDIGGHVADGQCGSDLTYCAEANLDVQYIMAVAWDVPTTYYYWDDASDFMVSWLVAVSSMTNMPQIFSISYGADETGITTSYASAFNTEAIKVGIMGVTLIAAAGDNGALSNFAAGRTDSCVYRPIFPASSPYVTAVGATAGPESGDPEVVCEAGGEIAITSGGGFSTRYSRPSYQDNAVAEYFRTVSGTANAPGSGYNTGGRGYPDVSLLGHNYVIILDGSAMTVDGTSASAPSFAGMVTLLNSYRLHSNDSSLSTVGWLNPLLYSTNGSFARDITSGDNKCSSAYTGSYGSYQATCCTQGYTAVTGWDPASGFGSIDYQLFVETFANTSPYPINQQSSSSSSSSSSTSFFTGPIAFGIIAAAVFLVGMLYYVVSKLCLKNCCRSRRDREVQYQAQAVSASVPPSHHHYRVQHHNNGELVQPPVVIVHMQL